MLTLWFLQMLFVYLVNVFGELVFKNVDSKIGSRLSWHNKSSPDDARLQKWDWVLFWVKVCESEHDLNQIYLLLGPNSFIFEMFYAFKWKY